MSKQHTNESTANIRALDELRKRRRKLELQMQMTQREFSHSTKSVGTSLQEVFLKRVALPLGVAGMAYLFIKKMTQKNGDPTTAKSPQPFSSVDSPAPQKAADTANHTSMVSSTTFQKWLPIAIQIFKVGRQLYKSSAVSERPQATTEEQQRVMENFLRKQ